MGLTRRKDPDAATISADGVALVRYDAACRAIAHARSVDEASKIRNQATALRAYAKQAKNRQLEIDACEIRIRAERRVGELIAAQKKTIGLNQGTAGQGRPILGGYEVEPPKTRLKDPRVTLADAGIDKKLSARGQELAAIPADEFETRIEDWRDRVQEPDARITQNIHFSSATPEHYTPGAIVDIVIECLGAIDLDPCSNDGTPNVPATTHYTAIDNGLVKPWNGRVYMNPPYGRVIDDWIEKLCAEYARRPDGVTEAIALLPSRTDTQWFHKLRDFHCCFIEGRLTFIGNDDPAPFPSVVVYLGDDLGKFYQYFHGIGDIWERVQRGVHFGE